MLPHENIVLPDCCYRVSVKLLIQNKEGKYLMTKGILWKWWFLWGGLDFWENVYDCAKREVKEECGLDLTDFDIQPKLFLSFKPPHKDFHVVWLCYSATIWDISKFIPSDECLSFDYFSLEEMERITLWDGCQRFFKIMKEK